MRSRTRRIPSRPSKSQRRQANISINIGLSRISSGLRVIIIQLKIFFLVKSPMQYTTGLFRSQPGPYAALHCRLVGRHSRLCVSLVPQLFGSLLCVPWRVPVDGHPQQYVHVVCTQSSPYIHLKTNRCMAPPLQGFECKGLATGGVYGHGLSWVTGCSVFYGENMQVLPGDKNESFYSFRLTSRKIHRYRSSLQSENITDRSCCNPTVLGKNA